MTLNVSQKKYLRGLGHQLHPTVIVAGSGLSDSVLAEYESTLSHHELIKVKVNAGERAERDAVIADLCSRSGAILVQRIGNVALVYRENPDQQKIRLPGAGPAKRSVPQ
ncbi:MAG TPA: YhbY family RNA-binding protein [Woeseiaceae bacterium]|nr:YhbY family RNA-binding protein [Woeseiaceae bacterium]